jgi:hypothetical protein
VLTAGPSAQADPVVRPDPSDGDRAQITLATGFDDALLPLSLAGTWTPVLGDRAVRLGGSVTVPMARPDLRDHRIDLGVEAPVRDADWDLWLGSGLRVVSTANDAYSGTSVGTVLLAAPGYHGPRGTLAAEGSLWTAWRTCLSTTRYAERQGGASGWSGCAPWTARESWLGVRAGLRRGPWELGLRAGYVGRGRYRLAIPPVYVRMSLGYRF